MSDSKNSRSDRGSGRGSSRRAGGAKKTAASSGGGRAGKGGKGAPRRDPDDTVGQLAGPLKKVLDRLPATQREVLEWRMGLKDGHPTPIGETAKHLGLTLHEAKEIEQRAFEHIREVVPLDRLQKLLKG